MRHHTLSWKERLKLRREQTKRTEKYSIGGNLKTRAGDAPAPITLRRADYEAQKGGRS